MTLQLPFGLSLCFSTTQPHSTKPFAFSIWYANQNGFTERQSLANQSVCVQKWDSDCGADAIIWFGLVGKCVTKINWLKYQFKMGFFALIVSTFRAAMQMHVAVASGNYNDRKKIYFIIWWKTIFSRMKFARKWKMEHYVKCTFITFKTK